MGYKPCPAWDLFKLHAMPYFHGPCKIIEMAPGNMKRSLVRKALAEVPGVEYHFADLNNRHADREGYMRMISEFRIDVRDGRFGIAVCYQALHNIARPWRWLSEVARIVHPGGLVVIVDSVNEDINQHPVDCGRWFPDGMDTLLDEAGLESELSVMRAADGRIIQRDEQFGGGQPVNLLTIGKKP